MRDTERRGLEMIEWKARQRVRETMSWLALVATSHESACELTLE